MLLRNDVWLPGEKPKFQPVMLPRTCGVEHPLVAYLMNEGGGRTLASEYPPFRGTFAGSTPPLWTGINANTPGPILGFNGSTAYVQIGYSPQVNLLTGFTLTARFELDTTAQNCVIVGKPFAATHTNPYFDWLMYYSNSDGAGINLRVGSSNVTNLKGLFVGRVWTTVSVSVNATTWRWYKDGILYTTLATAHLPTNTNSQGPRIGANADGSELLAGNMSFVMIHDRALAVPEVIAIHNDPFMWWRQSSPLAFLPEAGAPAGVVRRQQPIWWGV